MGSAQNSTSEKYDDSVWVDILIVIRSSEILKSETKEKEKDNKCQIQEKKKYVWPKKKRINSEC